MSLRRTALQRKTELRRTTLPRRTTTRAARAAKTMARQKAQPGATATGPTAAQRRTVAERAGYRCEVCARVLGWGEGAFATWTTPHSFHHRRPRAMGGTCRPDSNEPQNLLLLCGTGTTGCHGRVEANRTLALALGWLLRQDQDPATVPANIWHCDHHTTPRLLTRDGNYQEVA